MRIRFGQYEFSPSALMLVLALAGFSLFVVLGNWQLQRADYKRLLDQQYRAKLEQPYRFAVLGEELDEALRYQRVSLRGRYDMAHVLLVDNRLHKGNAGYHILLPFQLDGSSKSVWVNRGWISAGFDRNILPEVLPPRVSDRLQGIVTLPDGSGFRMGEVAIRDEWPQRIPYVDLSVINASVPMRMLPYVIWQAPEMDDYYVREWQPVWSPPEKSEAYAVQWFSFAAIVLLLLIVLNTRKIKTE